MKINLKNILGHIRFGAVQIAKGGFPLGNSIVNVVENISGKDLATGETKNVNWDKVIYKAIGAAVVIWLCSKGYIDADAVMHFINKFI